MDPIGDRDRSVNCRLQPKDGCLPTIAKETGIRPREAWRLKWVNIDFEQKMIYVRPEKGSKARAFRMSPKLEAMLKALPRKKRLRL
ncbi:MAG: tyrosine-type recombinase/integrase [Nitrososphaeria archaeon]